MIDTLLCKHKVLSLGPQQPHERPRVRVCACNPSAYTKIGESRDLLIRQFSQSVNSGFSEKPSLKNLKVESDEERRRASASGLHTFPHPPHRCRQGTHPHKEDIHTVSGLHQSTILTTHVH